MRNLSIVVLLVTAAARSASAAPLLVIPSGVEPVYGSVIVGPGTPPAVTYDVHLGSGILGTVGAVFDPALGTLLGVTLVGDVSSFFPSGYLQLLTTDLTQEVLVTFDFTTSSFDTSHHWRVGATGTALNPVTDPALLGLTGPLSAQFTFLTQIDLGTGFVDNVFTLDSIEAVPEPASLSLAGLGLAALALRHRRRSV